VTQSRSQSLRTDERAATIVRRLDDAVRRSGPAGASVTGLCAAGKVPRRTLNRAFQYVVGMGPATYLRRVRLNRARRALQRERSHMSTVKNVALELGFWHLGRFAEQCRKLFGESPHETLRRTNRAIGKARALRD
jgi:AraC family ethanolamine operon transcriptional activator